MPGFPSSASVSSTGFKGLEWARKFSNMSLWSILQVRIAAYGTFLMPHFSLFLWDLLFLIEPKCNWNKRRFRDFANAFQTLFQLGCWLSLNCCPSKSFLADHLWLIHTCDIGCVMRTHRCFFPLLAQFTRLWSIGKMSAFQPWGFVIESACACFFYKLCCKQSVNRSPNIKWMFPNVSMRVWGFYSKLIYISHFRTSEKHLSEYYWVIRFLFFPLNFSYEILKFWKKWNFFIRIERLWYRGKMGPFRASRGTHSAKLSMKLFVKLFRSLLRF